MRIRIQRAIGAVLLALLTCPLAVQAQAPGPDGVPDDPDAAYEPLLRGPVHEAFAEPYNHDPEPAIVVPKAPPEPIEELPPEIKPEGEDVVWISGYWAWDDERDDFIWVSGVWRKTPPGQRFVPGYWTEVDGGWQWVSGAWVHVDINQLHYLPEPPATLEQGPVAEAPTDDHFWIPGVWRYQEDRYVWRPGYWARGYDDWVWMPAHYIWTPRGCVYIGGYWDHPLASRGHLCAPIVFRRPVYVTAGFVYTPRVFITTTILLHHFWVRPNYCHYYFGDYYGPAYADWGLHPWFRYPYVRRGCYDPLYAWNRVHLGAHWHTWRGGIARDYAWYVANQRWRPPHTWRNQVVVQNAVNVDARQFTNVNINNIFLGSSIRDVVQRHDSQIARLDRGQREQLREQWTSVRDLAEQRRRAEALSSFGGIDLPERRQGGQSGRGVSGERGLAERGEFRLPTLDRDAVLGQDRGRSRREELNRQVQQILPRDASDSVLDRRGQPEAARLRRRESFLPGGSGSGDSERRFGNMRDRLAAPERLGPGAVPRDGSAVDGLRDRFRQAPPVRDQFRGGSGRRSEAPPGFLPRFDGRRSAGGSPSLVPRTLIPGGSGLGSGGRAPGRSFSAPRPSLAPRLNGQGFSGGRSSGGGFRASPRPFGGSSRPSFGNSGGRGLGNVFRGGGERRGRGR